MVRRDRRRIRVEDEDGLHWRPISLDALLVQHEAIDRDFDTADSVNLPLGSGTQGEGTLKYSTPGGSHVSLFFQADVGSVLGDQKACLLGGTALHAPG